MRWLGVRLWAVAVLAAFLVSVVPAMAASVTVFAAVNLKEALDEPLLDFLRSAAAAATWQR